MPAVKKPAAVPASPTMPDGGVSEPPNLDGGSQPTNRMRVASLTLQVIKQRATQLELKWAVWEEVAKKYDCEPPDPPEYLARNGMKNSTNVSWGTMESKVDEVVETYYNLACGGKTFLRFHSRAQGPVATKALTMLAEEHKIMWDGWNGRQEMIETLVFNRTLYPFSAVYYDLPHGWWGKALHPRNLVYPAGAGTDCDAWFWCAIRTSFEAWQLLKKLSNEVPAGRTGWKTRAIRKACEVFCKEGAGVLAQTVPGASFGNVRWDQLAPHDLAFNDRIPAFIVYVKEWDGRVSEHILVDHSEVGYVYSKLGKHAKLSDTLRIFPHGLGTGTLDSVRSYGVKSLTYHDALDRLTNSEYDTVLLTSSLILQGDGTTLDKLAEMVVNVGGITALPQGFAPAQVNFRDQAAGIRLMRQGLSAQLSRNTPALAGEVEIGDYEKSQREAAMLFQTSLQLGLFKVDRFHEQMSGFCQTHWRRLIACIKGEDANGGKEAKEFFQMCAVRGVPPDLLKSIYRVSHKTGGARGNRVNAQMGMDRVRNYYFGMFSEDGKRDFAAQDIHLSLDDEDSANVWLDAGKQGDDESDQARIAQLENSSMASGQPVQAAGNDLDRIHLREHTAFLIQETEACKAGQRDPAACAKTIGLQLQHAAPHFERAQQDKSFQQQIKMLAQQWSQFGNYRRQLEQQLAAHAQQQQRAQLEALTTPKIKPTDAQKIVAGNLKMHQDQERHEQEMKNRDEEHQQKIREGSGIATEA